VSDALDMLGMHGAVIGLSSLTLRGRICGRAITVKLGPPLQTISKRHLGVAAIAAAKAGDIIVLENPHINVSGWGGLLSLAAKRKGIAGIIVDGGCRDIDEACNLGLPVFARAAVPVTARGRIVEHTYGEPIIIGGVGVASGDLVIADGSGVVFIPASQALPVIEAAEEIFAREQLMAAAINRDEPLGEVLGANYEQMLKRGVRS
jgi:regulator of RNase E activity RraA